MNTIDQNICLGNIRSRHILQMFLQMLLLQEQHFCTVFLLVDHAHKVQQIRFLGYCVISISRSERCGGTSIACVLNCFRFRIVSAFKSVMGTNYHGSSYNYLATIFIKSSYNY